MVEDELVDVIDDDGNTLRVVPKKQAHTAGLLHKTVIGQVIDSQGRWLLVRQSADRQDAGQYVSPVGGHVSAGESDTDALKREAEEELGLRGEYHYELIGKAIFDRHVIGRHENHLFVMYKIVSDAEPVINHEAESWRYFTEEELGSELHTHPDLFGNAFRFVVEQFFPDLN